MNRHLRPAVTPDWLYRVPKLSGSSDSTVAKAMEYRPSDIGVGSDGRTLPLPGMSGDAGVEFAHSPRSIPASIFEVADPAGREAAKERAGL